MTKTTLNKILSNKDLSNYRNNGYASEEKSNIVRNPADDAWLKHSAIVEAVSQLKIKISDILDAGSYTPNHKGSPLYLAQKNNANLYCFDLIDISDFQKKYRKTKFYRGNFFENIDKVPDDSIDLVIDGCAVTHFLPTCEKSPNDGCTEFAKKIRKKMRDNAYFVCASDFDNQNKTGEFVSIESLIKSFSDGGLRLYGEKAFEFTDAFCNPMHVVRLVFTKDNI